MPGPFSARVLVLLIGALTFSAIGHAHTGVMAVALPISGIEIDGDLSDWPKDLRAYSVTSGDPERTLERTDASARFWVGHDRAKGHLYVALRFDDDRIVLKGERGDPWNAQDTCELFVDPDHGPARQQPTQFYFRGKFGANPDGRERFATVVRSVKDDHLIYEWRIDLGRLEAPRGPGRCPQRSGRRDQCAPTGGGCKRERRVNAIRRRVRER